VCPVRGRRWEKAEIVAGADETVNKDQVDFPENTQHIRMV
jgi:hypothetical protein